MDEHSRLQALQATQLLDTDPDPRFDRITRLAANSLGTEMAFVSLLDDKRQWFKSCVGLDLTETPRDIAFCNYTIQSDEMLIVLDAKRDVRFADNPLVTGAPFIRFYAGAPLITQDGQALGTLCVLDTKPRDSFDETERDILRDLALGVMTEIENDIRERQVQDLSVINRELEHRMGNMYAHVTSLVTLLDKSDLDHDTYVKRLKEKIHALSETQTLLAANKWQSVSIRELAIGLLKAFEPQTDRHFISIQEQDDFHITPRAAFAMSLLLNELGTNAVKHGALSAEGGTARFGWSGNDVVRFDWQETLKTPRQPGKPGKGFGSVILNRIVPKTFGGEATLDIRPEGLAYSVTAMTDRVRHTAG